MKGIYRYLLFGLLTCVISAIVIGLFGRVQGVEFCPQKFTLQEFSYYQVPLLGWQITPVTFSPSGRGNGPLSGYLRQQKLLGKVASELRWDIVQIFSAGTANQAGDAEILVKYLEQPGAVGTENWLAWTKNTEHAELVRVFWPVIAKLADRELYILMPDLFDFIRSAPTANRFVEHVRTQLAAEVEKLSEAEQLRENTDRANQLQIFAEKLRDISIDQLQDASLIVDEEVSDTSTDPAKPTNGQGDAEADPESEDF